MNALLVGLTLGGLAVGFFAGRSSTPVVAGAVPAAVTRPIPVQALPGQAPNDPRELIPLVPGPNDGPRQGPGPQPPGQQPGEGECTVLMFRDGQMYRMQPGEPQPGGQPGPGMPGGDGELFPLQPFPQPDQPVAPGPEMRV